MALGGKFLKRKFGAKMASDILTEDEGEDKACARYIFIQLLIIALNFTFKGRRITEFEKKVVRGFFGRKSLDRIQESQKHKIRQFSDLP